MNRAQEGRDWALLEEVGAASVCGEAEAGLRGRTEAACAPAAADVMAWNVDDLTCAASGEVLSFPRITWRNEERGT